MHSSGAKQLHKPVKQLFASEAANQLSSGLGHQRYMLHQEQHPLLDTKTQLKIRPDFSTEWGYLKNIPAIKIPTKFYRHVDINL